MAAAGGRVVKMIGDGSLSLFDGPARAIGCAHDFAEAARVLGLDVRTGLHTGEYEILAEDIAGVAVHIGARVSALAGPGEVLVSRTVKDLVVGSGLEFNPRGTHELKGVPQSWELFALVDGRSPTVPVAPDSHRCVHPIGSCSLRPGGHRHCCEWLGVSREPEDERGIEPFDADGTPTSTAPGPVPIRSAAAAEVHGWQSAVTAPSGDGTQPEAAAALGFDLGELACSWREARPSERPAATAVHVGCSVGRVGGRKLAPNLY